MADLTFMKLDEIAVGDISAREAGSIMAELYPQLDARSAQRIYMVLRSWVWKSLHDRRRDEELREWYTLIRTASKLMETKSLHVWSRSLKVIYELVDESVSVSETTTPEELFERAHTKEALIYLFGGKNKTRDRAELGQHLGLKQANLTRVMNLLVSSSLVERKRAGRSAVFRLTSEGIVETEKVISARIPDATRTLRENQVILARCLYHKDSEQSKNRDATSTYPLPYDLLFLNTGRLRRAKAKSMPSGQAVMKKLSGASEAHKEKNLPDFHPDMLKILESSKHENY